jgi:hypothetical protein
MQTMERNGKMSKGVLLAIVFALALHASGGSCAERAPAAALSLKASDAVNTHASNQSISTSSGATPEKQVPRGLRFKGTRSSSLPRALDSIKEPAKKTGKRAWSSTDKEQHSDVCRNKDRLTLAEKLQIIYLHQLAPAHERKKQRDLAAMFRKSRMTISKVLRKENVANVTALASSGAALQAKRRCNARSHHGLPEDEGRTFKVGEAGWPLPSGVLASYRGFLASLSPTNAAAAHSSASAADQDQVRDTQTLRTSDS